MKAVTGRGSAEGNDRMEAELATWLIGFEPSGAPTALRLRTFADLRAEAERPRRPHSWLVPVLSSVASLGAVAFGAGLIAVCAIAGNSLSRTGGGTGSVGSSLVGPQTGLPPITDVIPAVLPNPVNVLVLLFASLLASGIALLPRLWSFVDRLVAGRDRSGPAEPLAFRRSWRSISPLVWILGAWTAGLFAVGYQSSAAAWNDSGGMPAAVATYELMAPFVWIPFAVAVPLRYRLRDRSSRWLILGAVLPLATQTLLLVVNVGNGLGSPATVDVIGLLMTAYILALAAGLAGRAGSVMWPPRWLTAVAIGAAFAKVTTFLFLFWGPGEPLGTLFETGFSGISSWIGQIGWLAILWVGFTAARRSNAWGWRFVCAAGALMIVSTVPSYLSSLYFNYVASAGEGSPVAQVGSLELWWDLGAQTLATGALASALLSGLRPPRTPGDETVADQPAPNQSRPDDGRMMPFVLGPRSRRPTVVGLAMAAIIAAALFGIATGQLPWGSGAAATGIQWHAATQVPTSFTYGPYLASAGGRLYMVGRGGANEVWSSPDGVTWTRATDPAAIPNDFVPRAISDDGAGGLVVVGDTELRGAQTPTIWHSSDGRTFAAADVEAGTGEEIVSAAARSGQLVALGDHRAPSTASGSVEGEMGFSLDSWYSSDGTVWVHVALPDSSGYSALAVTGWQGGFAAVASPGFGGKLGIWTSADGRIWQKSPLVLTVAAGAIVAYEDSVVIIGTGSDGAASWSSIDGQNWLESMTDVRDPGTMIDAATVVGGTLVAVGSSHMVEAQTIGGPTVPPAGPESVWLWKDGVGWQLLPADSSLPAIQGFHPGLGTLGNRVVLVGVDPGGTVVNVYLGDVSGS